METISSHSMTHLGVENDLFEEDEEEKEREKTKLFITKLCYM